MEVTETKQKLLDIAEALFAEKGISATSVRNIVNAADANLAAIHYHFGSKEGLVRDVFARRIEPVNTERLRVLKEIMTEKSNGAPALEKIIEAFIGPPLRIEFEDKERHQLIMKLMAKVHAENHEIREMVFSQFSTMMEQFVTALETALPHLSRIEITWRFMYMVGAMFMTMSHKPDIEKMHLKENESQDIEEVIRDMIPFLAAGFRAPTFKAVKNGDKE